jgi:hypothetical protein
MTTWTRRFWDGASPWACAAVALLSACENLPLIPANQCGNRVVEADEECDDFPSDWCRDPGSVNECTIDCSRHACPEGQGCGADGVCRSPVSRFSTSSFAAGEAEASLSVGDMDGDLRDELLITGATHPVHARFGPDRTLVRALNISVSSERLTIGSLNGDGRDDLVGFAEGGEILVLDADDSGELAPVSHILAAPTGKAERVFAADSDGDGRPEPLLLVDDKVYSVPSESTGLFSVLLSGTAPAKDVAGQIPTGDFAHRSDSKVDASEFVLAALSAPRVHVYTLEDRFGAGEIASVELPAGQSVGPRGAFAGDYNGDHHLDLFVSSGSARQGLYVAYGVGDGSFHSKANSIPVAHGDNRFAPGALVLDEHANVRAIADLDADGRADLVLDDDAALNGESGIRCTPGGCGHPHERWASAVAADFNRDGMMDVIGTPLDTRELTFWMGIGHGSFNAFAIPTKGIPARTRAGAAFLALTVGDFDGDLAQDLAFAESEGSGSVDRDDLTVLFGKALGVPSELRQVGHVDRVKDLAAGSLFLAKNTLEDLVMLAEDGKVAGVGTFKGQTNRLMFSPLGVPIDPEHRAEITLENIFLGRFANKASSAANGGRRDDMVMFATSSRGAFFYFMENGPEGFENTNVSQKPSHLPVGAAKGRVGFAVTDVDDDGLDEVLIVPDRVVRGRLKYWVSRHVGSVFSYPGFADALRGAPEDTLGVFLGPHPTADVNADGRMDLTALAGRPTDDLAYDGSRAKYEMVVLNDSKGRLSSGTMFELPPHELSAYLNVDGDARLELCVAQRGGRTLALYDLDFQSFAAKPLLELATQGAIADLVVGDFDGNGVADLAVTSDRLEIFWGEADEP